MLLIKFVSHLNGIVHIFHFIEHSSGVISMASPVYLSTFYHQEETFILTFRQEIDSAFGNLCQCQITLFAVNGIRQAGRICSFFLDKNHFVSFAGFRFIVIVTTRHCISCFFKNRENTRNLLLVKRSIRFQETTACIEIKISLRQVKGNFIIHTTIRLVCVKCGWSGMVYTDRSSDTYFLAGFLRFFGYCLNRILIFSYRNSMIIRFLSRCQRSACSGRVGY